MTHAQRAHSGGIECKQTNAIPEYMGRLVTCFDELATLVNRLEDRVRPALRPDGSTEPADSVAEGGRTDLSGLAETLYTLCIRAENISHHLSTIEHRVDL